ncbi:predicted protein [Uncinocarpus reesii 1704]|uniref:Uncharacterized protein n=1 Tax=Uncinocarpus reesii (strain UAMH 1704) TaxID=336963 RepID=C4JR86_UNCRE|nr:uncharacterized protein UREG_03568 [Uncinocarpus reesii 1704]EEP78722.1 predicted protein [Uncinocarpus reesii 1704]
MAPLFSNAVHRLPTSELTPVKVRGKRKRPRKELEPMGVADSPSSSRDSLSRESPISLERKGFRATSKAKRNRSKSRDPRRFSRLESLPAELIEQIFLECLEFDLPRASPYLGAVLSTDLIYRGLILLSFWSDPDPADRTATAMLERMLRPFKYNPMDALQRQALQILVLDCRWCTFERIKSLVGDMIELSLCRWLSGADAIPTADVDFIKREYKKAPLSHIWQVHLDNFVNPRHKFDILQPYLSPLQVLALPDKVLRGTPWTDEKVHFLEFLRKHIRNVKTLKVWDALASRESIQEGIRSAILEHNIRALRALIELDESYHSLLDYRQLYTLPGEYFVLASRQGGHAITILVLLVRAASMSVPPDDPELTEWAIELQDKGVAFGGWLLNFMRDIPLFSQEEREPINRRFESYCPLYGPDYEQVFGSKWTSWLHELQETSYKSWSGWD